MSRSHLPAPRKSSRCAPPERPATCPRPAVAHAAASGPCAVQHPNGSLPHLLHPCGYKEAPSLPSTSLPPPAPLSPSRSPRTTEEPELPSFPPHRPTPFLAPVSFSHAQPRHGVFRDTRSVSPILIASLDRRHLRDPVLHCLWPSSLPPSPTEVHRASPHLITPGAPQGPSEVVPNLTGLPLRLRHSYLRKPLAAAPSLRRRAAWSLSEPCQPLQ